MTKILTKHERFHKYIKLHNSLPPIIPDLKDNQTAENVQIIIIDSFLDGYKKAKTKFKKKIIKLKKENELLKKEIENLKSNNETLQNKQIATANRFGFLDAYEKASKTGSVAQNK